ncbi:MAG: tRNA (adenosine(37)-N6)-threonylcarbamoyltransferase complex dimerization subunit type 1 TsaB [Thermoanaerobaculia bacterium]|nr:tRNA (adenosine(37)-N6)-threonylcarbamoyltransferase complex dimerization subunit type 1 TsaB [Thermoanaerobaculia bacterium]
MAPEARRTVLAIDAGSPVASVALAKGERILAESRSEDATSSRHLLEQVDAVLREAGCALPDLGGVVALRGPGSFTGLRVGMATVLGLHQATGVPATALPTLTVLASLAPAAPVLAAVDALRGLWFHQRFDRRPGAPPSPLGEPAQGRARSAAASSSA